MNEPTYFNPVWYRDDWRIYRSSLGEEPFKYHYSHKNYTIDDNRAGYATSIDDAKDRIDARYIQ